MHPWLETVQKNNGLFLIVRHGKTTKAATDAERELTPEGELLAFEAGKALRQHERLAAKRLDTVFASPARRCQMTAEIIRFGRGRLTTINALYPNTPEGRAIYPNLIKTFEAHGNKSIADYCSTNHGCSEEFDRYAKAVLEEMATHTLKATEAFVAIVTHAVLAPAIALEIARMYRCVPQFKESLEAITLGECDAILLSPFLLELVRAPKG